MCRQTRKSVPFVKKRPKPKNVGDFMMLRFLERRTVNKSLIANTLPVPHDR
jgi:hypothetical protein